MLFGTNLVKEKGLFKPFSYLLHKSIHSQKNSCNPVDDRNDNTDDIQNSFYLLSFFLMRIAQNQTN